VLHSCKLVLLGFAAAIAVGVPARARDGLEPRGRGARQSGFLVAPPIPPLAWIPLAIVWLGSATPRRC
jgi:NitT/TauT family transport system permease protein/taurine transport system permease protein